MTLTPEQLDERVARRWWPLVNVVLADQPADLADLLTPERLEQHLELRISTEPRPYVTCDTCAHCYGHPVPKDLPERWQVWFEFYVYDDAGNDQRLARIAGGLIGARVTGSYDQGFTYWYDPDPQLDPEIGPAPIEWPEGPTAKRAPAWP